MKLKYLITGFLAVAATAYILNTFSISKIPHGIQLKNNNNTLQMTSNNGKKELINTYTKNNENIKTTIGLDSGIYSGSINTPEKSASFKYDKNNSFGSIDGFIDDKILATAYFGRNLNKINKDSTKISILDSLILGFDYLYNKNGVLSGARYYKF
ncbi:MAG: hypothetical protein ACP5NV_05965 [Candidatus Woesearchaeota archaeon]